MKKKFSSYQEAWAFIQLMRLEEWLCYEQEDDYLTTYVVVDY